MTYEQTVEEARRRIERKRYTDRGYTSRKDYLDSLAEDYNLDIQAVYALANILGVEEDFDGLVSSCQDMEGY